MTELSLLGALVGEDCHSDVDMKGGFLVYILLVLYSFYILAKLCDGHLTTCLEVIVEKMGLSHDVAGATFLAMASSAPELFCSIISTFVLVNPAGVGNIVGSALFNLLCIIGVLPLVSKTGPLRIWWYPTVRDAAFYVLSIVELAIFMADERILWWEALVMCISYALYVTYFAYNQRICDHFGWKHAATDALDKESSRTSVFDVYKSETDQEEVESEGGRLRCLGTLQRLTVEEQSGVVFEEPEVAPVRVGRPVKLKAPVEHEVIAVQLLQNRLGADEEGCRPEDIGFVEFNNFKQVVPDAGPLEKPSSQKDLDLTDFPFTSHVPSSQKSLDLPDCADYTPFTSHVRSATVAELSEPEPDPEATVSGMLGKGPHEDKDQREVEVGSSEQRRTWCPPEPGMWIIDRLMPNPERWVAAAFSAVSLWIAIFTYIMVDGAERLGCMASIPPVVMGLVVLAAGTSIPDMIASMAVAREGKADMAAANAVGSNTFDILLGLGLPWLVATAMGKEILVPAKQLTESIVILGASLFIYLLMLWISRMWLTRPIGWILLTIYFGSITFTLVRYYEYYAVGQPGYDPRFFDGEH